ncbi:MAG: ATP-binding protein, partial [Sedimentibacter sp.]
KKILKPINEMTKSLDDMLEEESKVNMKIYEEFEPLSNTIKDQKNKINEYINEIKYERDNISFITSNMKEGFILLNHNKDILSINKSGKIMIGNENFELKGNRNIFELTRSPEIIEKINDSIKENKHLIHDVETSDKCYRYYFSPVVEQNKIIKGLLILIEDITIQKKSEIMRSEFTANVSHELKTPLTTMIGFAEMIKEGLITGDDIEKYSALIHKEGMRLISLIEDLMRLSKIQEHTQNVEEKLINIKDISEDVVNLLKSKAEDYNVKLILNADNVVMKANNNYINELLYNLIDNGIKYNKDGGSVNIKIYEKDGLANIVISDTGVGISSKHIDRIFERFYRVDKSRSKETGGTGLGLSIVKHIAELYDGTIDIKSSKNKGTEITIKFPA